MRLSAVVRPMTQNFSHVPVGVLSIEWLFGHKLISFRVSCPRQISPCEFAYRRMQITALTGIEVATISEEVPDD